MNDSRPVLWTSGFFNERFPEPVSPLGWSVLGPLIEELALREPLRYLGYPGADTIPILRLWHGHPYTNAMVFHILYKVFPDFLLPEDAYRYFPDGNVALRRRAPYPSSLFSPRLLLSVARGFLSDPGNWLIWHNYRKWEEYAPIHDRRVQALLNQIKALERNRAGLDEILSVHGQVDEAHRDLLRIHRWSLMHADLSYSALTRLIAAWVDRERASEIASRWVAGASNKTIEVDSALRQLAAYVKSWPALGEAVDHAVDYDEFLAKLRDAGTTPNQLGSSFIESFHSFLSIHGHRSFSLDIAAPTLEDDPMQVVKWLQTMDDEESPQFSSSSPSLVGLALRGWKRRILDNLRSLAVKYMALREDQRYYWQKSLALSRRIFLLAANLLVAEGVIGDRQDIFYATLVDLFSYARKAISKQALTDRIVLRRTEWATFMKEFRSAPSSSYPLFLGTNVTSSPASGERMTWHARAVSPGTARGAARVVRSPNELSQVRRGDILVAPSTDPAWTPVFTRIAGLVMERGGVLSHGAVVAREYGVPAVAGVANILEQVTNGETLEVDGNIGRVERLVGDSVSSP